MIIETFYHGYSFFFGLFPGWPQNILAHKPVSLVVGGYIIG